MLIGIFVRLLVFDSTELWMWYLYSGGVYQGSLGCRDYYWLLDLLVSVIGIFCTAWAALTTRYTKQRLSPHQLSYTSIKSLTAFVVMYSVQVGGLERH